MRKIEKIFEEYLGSISLVSSPHFCAANFGCISVLSLLAIMSVSVYYFQLSWKTGCIMLIIMFLLEHSIYFINVYDKNSSFAIYISVFILSWIGQFYGHKIEGKKPSFLRDLQFLLVGPIWLLHLLLQKLKY